MALWLAWETRRLRLSSESQINLLREQSRSSSQPYIFLTIKIFDKDGFKKFITDDETKSAEEQAEALVRLNQTDTLFLCILRNASNHIARDVEVWIYDSRTRNFLESHEGAAILIGEELTTFSISPPFLSVEEVRSGIYRRYGKSAAGIADAIALGRVSYSLVIYRDIEKRVYSTIRSFSITGDEVYHLPGD